MFSVKFGQKTLKTEKKFKLRWFTHFLPRYLPKRCKLAKTTCFSQDHDKIRQKCTIFEKFFATVDKNSIRVKNTFCFFDQMSLFQF